jgi:Arc/MetJ family transcription regulator
MRTTLNIDDQVFTNLMQLTNARTRTEAVRIALSDYVRLKRKEQLIALRGKLEIEDNWQALRSLEIQESEETVR